ncbi:hypothetical protein [Biostraticola tofi]|uniref:Uncharacterized protein n=1 Tax=Biostraticola tofi TaxID=466109 RepID=A0A4R3Z1I4_9GAMM|nr:hypothetical protein [Biostraticola tofi]TCV98757.1 hypothetical protein EDC52_10276 [Biostraticola tofi]
MIDKCLLSVYHGWKKMMKPTGTPHRPASDYLQHALPLILKHHSLPYIEQREIYYGAVYRGGVVASYLLGFVAVLCAAIPLSALFSGILLLSSPYFWAIAQLIAIVLIIIINLCGGNSRIGKKLAVLGETFPAIKLNQNWKEKWQLYRVAGEILRYRQFILFLYYRHGEKQPFVSDNINRMMETLIADEPLITSELLLIKLKTTLHQQITTTRQVAGEQYALAHRLHRNTDIAFVLALLTCVLNVVVPSTLLSCLTVLLPVWGATCHGLVSTGEYLKLSKQYQLTANELEVITAKLDALPNASEDDLSANVTALLDLVFQDQKSWLFYLSASHYSKE